MLTVSQLTKSYGGRVLLENASLQLNRGERIGLVGPNGAGKTTLFSLILGEAAPDEGRVALERGATVGFLPQESAPAGEESVLEMACAVSPALAQVRRVLATAEAESEAYHEAQREWAERDGPALEARAKRVQAGLAFREADFARPARALSGGWVMRAHLARLLTMEPDLLLLDEPTNHLDLESLGWFQEHLRACRSAVLVISHDREFLNRLVGAIVELSQRKLTRYRGSWDDYVREKAAREEQQLAAFKNQQREIADLQRFADRFRAKASKASQAQSKLKQIERMEKIEAPEAREKTVGKFRFPQPLRSGRRVITLRGVEHAYGELVVYRGLEFEAERGQRTVLVGPNGAGKSTLLKLLAGVLPVQRGARELGHNVRAGYFAQQRVEMLDPRQTVLESALALATPPGEQLARTVLGSFLFRGDDVFKPVGVLSGGEKSRLALARLLLDPPNLLLMDEPTTHLDIGSIDALLEALGQFEGTLIFISHDVHFIRALATSVLHITAGQLTPYPGGYDYYLDKTRAASARDALVAGARLTNFQPQAALAPAAAPAAPGLREIRAARKAEAKAQRDRERRIAEIETEIADLENQQAQLATELESPAAHVPGGHAAELTRALGEVAARLERLFTEWENASA